MVAYMWNMDRKTAFVKIIDAFEVTAAAPELEIQAADLKPVTPDFEDNTSDPEPMPTDML